MQLVTRPEPWVVGEFTGKATHGLGNRRRAFWHVLQNRIRLRGVKGPAGVEDALVVGDEDVDAVDVAAAGRDALGQLGDDAHGVLAVSIRPRSVEAAAAAPDGAAGTGMRWGGTEEGKGETGVRGTGRGGCRGGCRRARRWRAAAAPWTASADEPIDLLYLSILSWCADGWAWVGCPSPGGWGGADDTSRRCQFPSPHRITRRGWWSGIGWRLGACLLRRTTLDGELGDFTNAASELLLPVMLHI